MDGMLDLARYGLPPAMMQQLKVMMDLSGAYQDKIDESYKPFFAAADEAQAGADRALAEYKGAQNEPLNDNPLAAAANAGMGGAADLLAPKRGFREAAQQDRKTMLAQLLQRRQERLGILEKASDLAADRALKLGDTALQAKHLKEAQKWSTAREQLVRSVGDMFEGARKAQADTDLETLRFKNQQKLKAQDILGQLQVEAHKTRRDLFLKYGSANPTPGEKARIDMLEKVFGAQFGLVTKAAEAQLNNPLGNADPQKLLADGLEQIRTIGEAYARELGGDGTPQPKQEKPPVEEAIFRRVQSGVNQFGLHTFRGFQKVVDSEMRNGELAGVPKSKWMEVARPYYAKVEPLMAEYKSIINKVNNPVAPELQRVLEQTDPATLTAHRKDALRRYGRRLQEIQTKLEGYGIDAMQLGIPSEDTVPVIE